ncbi:MAG: hypothetical protein KJO50_01650 [Bacteroidia bacterium]|nr:hypothetical protein [Bacteroidia bacterium]
MQKLTFSIIFLFIAGFTFGQNLDEELGFIYVKADYLLETDRYEEAIAEFNKIINQDPAYKDALYKRAKAKYALAAYKGVKKDLLLSFEHIGMTQESILLFGEAQEASGDAGAPNTMEIASRLYPDNRKAKKYKKKKEQETGAEEEPKETDTEGGLKEEVKKLEEKISSILDDLLPDDEKNNDEKEGDNQDETGNAQEPESENENDSEGDLVEDTPKENKKINIPDNSVNEIYIDEDLTLEIRNGLGSRTILQQPNILILSETSGKVAVNVCVNRNGKVVSAEYDGPNSTINTQSLISLAVRKSKEFWFEKSDVKEMCGSIIFIISGRA